MDYEVIECPTCEGRGSVDVWSPFDDLGGYQPDQCPECEGSGSVTVWDYDGEAAEFEKDYCAAQLSGT